jgi:hypothetical protein
MPKRSAAIVVAACVFMGCAPTRPSAVPSNTGPASGAPNAKGESERLTQWRTFFAARPDFKGKELCVLKVAAYGPAQTWEEVAHEANRLCLLGDDWVLLSSTQTGASFFVDATSITLRDRNQVDAWLYGDWPSSDPGTEFVDSEYIGSLSREIYDCDKRVAMTVATFMIDARGEKTTMTADGVWQAAPPGSVLAGSMDALCAYRTAVLNASTPAKPRMPARTVEKVRPPTEEEVERALRTYLHERFAF